MEYQLVIQFAGDSTEVFDAMIAIEDELFETVTDAEVDGHDIGSGEANIFVLTDDPAATFAQIKPVLDNAGYLDAVKVAFRETDGEDFTVLWPQNFNGHFEVL